MFESIAEFLGFGHKDKLVPPAVSTAAPTETESARLARIREQHLADIAANTRTRPGAGAFGGTSIPETTAEPGKPVFTRLAERGQLPAKDTTNTGRPL